MAAERRSQGDRGTLRDHLEARHRELTARLQVHMARIRERGSTAAMISESPENDTGELDVVVVEITTTMLRRIDQALKRLDAGEYGLCTRCREPIAEARLRALPFAVCCRQCETAREREAAHARSDARTRVWAGTLRDELH